MKGTHVPTFAALAVAATVALVVLTPLAAAEDSYQVTIDVAPAILNLDNNGSVVTVHANILYAQVQSAELYIGASTISSWRTQEDDLGYFVASFEMDDIKAAVLVDQPNTFTLIGIDLDNCEFWGQQVVKVINGDADTNTSKLRKGKKR